MTHERARFSPSTSVQSNASVSHFLFVSPGEHPPDSDHRSENTALDSVYICDTAGPSHSTYAAQKTRLDRPRSTRLASVGRLGVPSSSLELAQRSAGRLHGTERGNWFLTRHCAQSTSPRSRRLHWSHLISILPCPKTLRQRGRYPHAARPQLLAVAGLRRRRRSAAPGGPSTTTGTARASTTPTGARGA